MALPRADQPDQFDQAHQAEHPGPQPGGDRPPGEPRLNRPWRALAAAVEVLLAAAAVGAALWAWPRGVATVTSVLSDGTELVSTRYFGNWMAGSIAFGTLAGVLLVDAVRQLVLAVRIRTRRADRTPNGPSPAAG